MLGYGKIKEKYTRFTAVEDFKSLPTPAPGVELGVCWVQDKYISPAGKHMIALWEKSVGHWVMVPARLLETPPGNEQASKELVEVYEKSMRPLMRTSGVESFSQLRVPEDPSIDYLTPTFDMFGTNMAVWDSAKQEWFLMNALEIMEFTSPPLKHQLFLQVGDSDPIPLKEPVEGSSHTITLQLPTLEAYRALANNDTASHSLFSVSAPNQPNVRVFSKLV